MKNRNTRRPILSASQKVKSKKLLLLAVSFVVIFGVYEAGLSFQWKWIVYVYLAAMTVTGAAFVLLNRGFDSVLPDMDDLPQEWDDAKKTAYLERESKKRSAAKKLLYVFIPLMITFAIDILVMAFFSGE